jgi:hypothetical protein
MRQEPRANWYLRPAKQFLCLGAALLGAACTGEIFSGDANLARPPSAACPGGNCAGAPGLTPGSAGSSATAAPGGPGETASALLEVS